MKTFTFERKLLTSSKRLLSVFILTCAALGGVATAHAIPVLDSLDANGFGDNGGAPYEFTFENPFASVETEFDVALLEYLDYDSLGISIVSSTGAIVVPLIQSSPGNSHVFTFTSAATAFTALVFAEGDGAFGLGILALSPETSVPEPGTLGLVSVAMIGLCWARGRRRGRVGLV